MQKQVNGNEGLFHSILLAIVVLFALKVCWKELPHWNGINQFYHWKIIQDLSFCCLLCHRQSRILPKSHSKAFLLQQSHCNDVFSIQIADKDKTFLSLKECANMRCKTTPIWKINCLSMRDQNNCFKNLSLWLCALAHYQELSNFFVYHLILLEQGQLCTTHDCTSQQIVTNDFLSLVPFITHHCKLSTLLSTSFALKLNESSIPFWMLIFVFP